MLFPYSNRVSHARDVIGSIVLECGRYTELDDRLANHKHPIINRRNKQLRLSITRFTFVASVMACLYRVGRCRRSIANSVAVADELESTENRWPRDWLVAVRRFFIMSSSAAVAYHTNALNGQFRHIGRDHVCLSPDDHISSLCSAWTSNAQQLHWLNYSNYFKVVGFL